MQLVKDHLAAIRELAGRYGVQQLDVFGSVVEDRFDPGHSDVDFLVEFAPGYDLGPWLSRYFDLRRELEGLLGRKVDLIMAGASKNPHFLRQMAKTRRTIYASKDAQAS